jgi:MFS family permease
MNLRTANTRIPRGIWVLGMVSLFMDISSEMIHSLLPVYLVTALGVSMLTVGVIEGIAEATALFVKLFSGALSDHIGRRKPLALAGYALGALSKPLFALSSGAGMVFTARVVDRVGKGIRGAPRDALIADLTPPHIRGAAYGLRQSLDTVGAMLGPVLAIGLMLLWANDFCAVFWIAVIPASLAVLLLLVGVREPALRPGTSSAHPLRRDNLRRLPRAYWWVVAIGSTLTLARFSEAFLVLRAQDGGLALAWTPLVLIVMHLAYAMTAYPFGKLSDRVSRHKLLAAGLVVLALSDLALAAAPQGVFMWLGVLLWGLHMGMTQGLLAAMVSATSPSELRGTAFGCYSFASGICVLVASTTAGLLWHTAGASSAFLAGVVFCTLALLLLAAQVRTGRTRR